VLPADVADELRVMCEHSNAHYWTMKRLRLPTYGESPIDRTWSCGCGKPAAKCVCGAALTLPRGVLPAVRATVERAGYSLRVADLRELGLVLSESLVYRRPLRAYQSDAIAKMVAAGGGILRAPTGSGKTSTLLALTAFLSTRSLVVVHSSALFRQWQERVRAELGIEPGVVQGKTSILKPVTIAMQKTLWSRGIDTELREYFGAILCDEIQFFASKTFREVIDLAPHFYRFGASADQRRKDGKEYLIHDTFGPVVAEVGRKELVEDGFVVPVEVRVYETDTEADWYGVPESDHDHERKIDVSRLRKELAADPVRNQIALEAAAQEAEAGKFVFVMAHEREHCRALAAALSGVGIPAGLLLGGPESRAEFDRTLSEMRAGTLRVGVGTYQAIGTGLDVPALDAVVCVTPIASNRQFFGQVIGRACRPSPGKKGARMHYLWDSKIFGKRAVQNMCAWNDGPVLVQRGSEWTNAKTWRR
jgi:superfamily II DNA or RNA helicase